MQDANWAIERYFKRKTWIWPINGHWSGRKAYWYRRLWSNATDCHSGGYGLIQWTTLGRYRGLGNHARSIGGNPSTLQTQLSYLVTEREWKSAEWKFKTPGKSIGFYMNGAYTWLGWGIHGARTNYSNQYVHRLTPAGWSVIIIRSSTEDCGSSLWWTISVKKLVF